MFYLWGHGVRSWEGKASFFADLGLLIDQWEWQWSQPQEQENKPKITVTAHWSKCFSPLRGPCWALPSVGPLFFLPSTSPSFVHPTDVLTVSVYGPKLKPGYSKIRKTQFPSLWSVLPNGEDSKILKGTETSTVPEDETCPSLGGRRQAGMASWRRWPQSCTFRVSRQVLTMKRRREAIRTVRSTLANVWVPETESLCMKKTRKSVYRAHLSQGMLRVEAEGARAQTSPILRAAVSAWQSAANIHKSWLSFLLSQGSGAR